MIGVVAMMRISCNRVREIVKHKTSLRMQIIRFQHDPPPLPSLYRLVKVEKELTKNPLPPNVFVIHSNHKIFTVIKTMDDILQIRPY